MNSGRLLLAWFGWMIFSGSTHGAGSEAENWPSWRGPAHDFSSTSRSVPLQWSATENVAWKVALPEPGNSSPVVWEDRIFVAQAEGQRRTLICFRRSDGKQLWQQGLTYTENERTHRDNPYCSATPVTDGQRVIVWFGSAGLVCYDFEGTELWKRDLGKQDHEWGYASSPVLQGDLCFLNFGPGDNSALLALNKTTGKTVWRVDLPPVQPEERTDGFAGRQGGVIGSWSTPALMQANDRWELIVSLPEMIKAFNPANGRELWVCHGLNPLIYTSAIFGEGVVVGMGGYSGTAMAVRAGGDGDVTQTHRLWRQVRTANRIGSGVIHQGHIYILNTPGVAECLDLQTGRVLWSERLRGPGPSSESWSSMVRVADRIYAVNQSGDTLVIRAAPQFELLATNSVGYEKTNSTLALAGEQIFLRTHKNLWCFAQGQNNP